MLLSNKEKGLLKIQYSIKLIVILAALALIVTGAVQDKTALLIAGWVVFPLAIYVPVKKPRSPRMDAFTNWYSIRQEVLANGIAATAILTNIKKVGSLNKKPLMHMQYWHTTGNTPPYATEEWIVLPDYVLAQLRPQIDVPVICSKSDPTKATLNMEIFSQALMQNTGIRPPA